MVYPREKKIKFAMVASWKVIEHFRNDF